MSVRVAWIAGALSLICATMVGADEPQGTSDYWLTCFSENWSETDWQKKTPRHLAGYMRPRDDEGWQARMRSLQGCVQQGDAAVSVLLEALHSMSEPEQIFAAQALGYMGSSVAGEKLIRALNSATDPAVRLYLVDALGMLGKGSELDWNAYLETESNRDVRRHVDYVRLRGGAPLNPRVIDELKHWNAGQIDSATIGEPAPDFTLMSAQGDKVHLSHFRGSKSVVVVFVYGDT